MGLFKALLVPLVFSAVANAQLRIVFKGHSSAMIAAKRMTFGLSASQVEKIADLTNGTVQFGDVYYIDQSPNQAHLLRNQPGFSGVIYPDIPPPVKVSTKPGDPELVDQWWIEKLGVFDAWPMATGSGVVIADCDAGYFHDEADLFSNMKLEHRYDLSNSEEPLVVNDGPYASHGTSVTAIIAGVLNGVGTNGIAYNSKIVPLQNYNYNKTDTLDKEEATARCILKAIATPDVDIIVLENQTATGSSETFIGTRDAVRLAQNAGLIVVSAAGNYSKELVEEVADDTGSIIVGALHQNDTIPYWSNYGERITVSAYGEKLRTLSEPNGVYKDFGGTSGATPQVAAAVALMKEVNPMLTPDQARDIFIETRKTSPATLAVGGVLAVPAAVIKARQTPVDFAAVYAQWLFRQELKAILAL